MADDVKFGGNDDLCVILRGNDFKALFTIIRLVGIIILGRDVKFRSKCIFTF